MESTGGLLNASDDLRVLWLSLRSEGHAIQTRYTLLREHCSLNTFVNIKGPHADIRAGSPALYVPTLRLPWAEELKNVLLKQLGVRLLPVADNDSPLRAKDIIDVLERPSYGARWNELLQTFYHPLREEYVRYNQVVIDYLQSLHTPCILTKVGNLVRLAYMNSLLGGLRKAIAKIHEERDALNEEPSSGPFPCSVPASESTKICEEEKESSSSTPLRTLRGLCIVQAHAVRDSSRSPNAPPRAYIVSGVVVPADLLGAVTTSLARDYRLYIQCDEGPSTRRLRHSAGSLVSLANHGTALLDCPGLPISLPQSAAFGESDFLDSIHMHSPWRTPRSSSPPRTSILPSLSSLSISPMVHLPSVSSPMPIALPPPRYRDVSGNFGSRTKNREHRSVDAYLRQCYGVGWSNVCNAAIRNAHRQLRQKKLDDLSVKLSKAQESKEDAEILRKEMIDKAIAHDMAATGLAGTCAIIIAKEISEDDLECVKEEAPSHVCQMIVDAHARLQALEKNETVSKESFMQL